MEAVGKAALRDRRSRYHADPWLDRQAAYEGFVDWSVYTFTNGSIDFDQTRLRPVQSQFPHPEGHPAGSWAGGEAVRTGRIRL